jgi:hypothetical protein
VIDVNRGRLENHDGVPVVQQHLTDQLDSLFGTVRDHDVVGGYTYRLAFEELCDPFAELAQSGTVAVFKVSWR